MMLLDLNIFKHCSLSCYIFLSLLTIQQYDFSISLQFTFVPVFFIQTKLLFLLEKLACLEPYLLPTLQDHRHKNPTSLFFYLIDHPQFMYTLLGCFCLCYLPAPCIWTLAVRKPPHLLHQMKKAQTKFDKIQSFPSDYRENLFLISNLLPTPTE